VKTQNLTPFILFAFVVAMPACLQDESASTGASSASLISPPASCGTGDPTCNTAIDYPDQSDLSVTNSSNLVFSSADGALNLEGGSGSAALVDSDGDGVPDPSDDCAGPGWRLPCDGDKDDDGAYQTAYYDAGGDNTVSATIEIQSDIRSADVYILMDATGSMSGEQNQLVADLTSGTFVDPGDCPGGADTGIVGAIQCVIPDVWMGVGDFKEVSYLPHNNRYDMAPYHHYLDTTNNIQHVLDAVSAFRADSNKDLPEAHSQALYSVVTGQGLGDLVPNRGACPSPSGRWGYPCFRDSVLPIILLFSDADMWNGPVANGHTYGNPPFDGTLGMGTRLPPVEQSPNILYSSDPFTAWDLGDVTNRSLTVMGSNTNLGNDAQTWDKGTCLQCSGPDCWTDGRDAFLKFSLSSPADLFLSGEGTAYHTMNTALFDAALGAVDCNPGPGGGDFWGRFGRTVPAGDWYAVSDASVGPSNSVSQRRGNFQLRIHNQTADPGGYPSWQTADLPIPWTTVETELLANGVKLVSVVSPNSGGYIAIPDLTELGIVTGSVDLFGDPYLEQIAGDGSGLGVAVLEAMQALVGDTRRNVTLVPEDNLATPTVDETLFVSAVVAKDCPDDGIPQKCIGGAGTTTCLGCLAGANIEFQFRVGNDFVPPTATAQIFDFDMRVMVDGTTEIARYPVRIMVPPTGSNFGAGFYQNTYEADFVCEMPPERPDWGTLTWIGSTPSDSSVRFEFFTADTLADLDTVIPVSLTYADPTDVTPKTYDIGAELVLGGEPNYRPYLRVRARLEASTDTLSTPVFAGWSMEFNCVPLD